MPEVLEITDLEKALDRLEALERAALEMLAAIEAGDADQIARAKRRLGLVLADV